MADSDGALVSRRDRGEYEPVTLTDDDAIRDADYDAECLGFVDRNTFCFRDPFSITFPDTIGYRNSNAESVTDALSAGEHVSGQYLFGHAELFTAAYAVPDYYAERRPNAARRFLHRDCRGAHGRERSTGDEHTAHSALGHSVRRPRRGLLL